MTDKIKRLRTGYVPAPPKEPEKVDGLLRPLDICKEYADACARSAEYCLRTAEIVSDLVRKMDGKGS